MNRQPSGRKPTWKFTAACGAMTQTGKAGGIGVIRYRRKVLVPKLILWQESVA